MTTPEINYTARKDAHFPKNFRENATPKILKVTKLDPSLIYIDVIVSVSNNPSRSLDSHKVEITAQGSGHVSRAESHSDTFESALDDALDKLDKSMRKVKERRSVAKSGHRTPESIHDVAVVIAKENSSDDKHDPYEDEVDFYEPGQIVRTKSFKAQVLDPEDALGNMESLNHDFYLFINKDTDRPSVVYRRLGFDYGLIELI